MQLFESIEGLPSQEQENVRILKIAYFLENYIEMRTGNFVIFEVDALMYAVLCAL
jgi:hypothetical protein